MAGISSKALKSNYYENHKQFNGIEHTTDLDLNEYDAFYRTLDPQLGRFLQIDPKPDTMSSPYSLMHNNPVLYDDPLGDTTYLFNNKGIYLGMKDVDVNGIRGSVGEYKTYTDAKGKKFQGWNGSLYFSFNDPATDKIQLGNLKVGEKGLRIVSDGVINDIMKKSDIGDKNFVARFYFAGTESGSDRDMGNGNKMDFGVEYLNGKPGGGSADAEGGFYIFGSQKKAYNAMDGGNFLWGQAMKRLGFSYSTAKAGSEANEKFHDSKTDQAAIREGFHYKVSTTAISTFTRIDN